MRRGEHRRGPIGTVQVCHRSAMWVRVAVVLALAVVAAAPARGLNPELDVSQYAHTAWKTRDGFTQGIILAMAQTPDGYLWLGTEFGLYRFDGVRAVPWQPPDGRQLPGNRISDLLLAHDGTLWISTIRGLASWKDGNFTQYPEFAGQVVGPLLEDHQRTIWVGAYNPGRLCAMRAGKAQCFSEGRFGAGVFRLYEDHRGNLWALSSAGLWRWEPAHPDHYSLRGQEINAIAETDVGELLLATTKGLKRLAGGKFQDYTLPAITGRFRATNFFRSSDGSLWIGSLQGLLHLHHRRIDTFGTADGLSGDFVNRILEDREGNVWVSTSNGLDRFREYAIPTVSRSQGLSASDTWSVQATSNGSIWIGTASGLNQWLDHRVTVYGGQTAIGRDARNLPQHVAGVISGNPRGMGLDDGDRLYVSTQDVTAYFENDRFIRVPGAPSGNVWSIAGDGQRKLWANNGMVGLYHFAPGETAQPIPWSRFGQKGFGAQAMLPDRANGGVWLGFWDGGIVYFKDGEVRASYSAAQGLGSGRVTDLRFGSRGTLWVGTEGGLSRIRDGRVLTLTSKNGLPCDSVHWSIEDDDHFVWLYMHCGLVRIARSELDAWVSDPKHSLQVWTLDASDGVTPRGPLGGYGPHVTKAPDGKIWFATGDGVGVIDPRHLPFNKLPPPVRVEQITADHKPYDATLAATSDGNGQVRLPALVRELEIDYTALSLVAPEKVRFRYMLEGYDREWQDAGTRRQAFYTGLSPKHYRFRVAACNNSGVWNEAGTFLDFSVTPAYYQTLWFRVGVAAAVAALIFALYQLRLQQISQQFKMRMEERVSERERIARDLHDTFLQSVQGLVYKFSAIATKIPCEEEACQEMEDALDLADAVLAEGRDRVRNLRDATVSLSDLPAAFRRVAQECPQSGTADFTAVVEGNVRDLHPLVLEESFCIGREALMNALTHSGGQHVEAEITYDAKQFRIRVRDDGRGIDTSILEHGGRDGHWGMRGMRERAQRIGAQLKLWSREGSGTEVELLVPAATAYRPGGAQPKEPWFRRMLRTGGEQA